MQVENRFGALIHLLSDVSTTGETKVFTERGDDVLLFDWVSCYTVVIQRWQLFSSTHPTYCVSPRFAKAWTSSLRLRMSVGYKRWNQGCVLLKSVKCLPLAKWHQVWKRQRVACWRFFSLSLNIMLSIFDPVYSILGYIIVESKLVQPHNIMEHP